MMPIYRVIHQRDFQLGGLFRTSSPVVDAVDPRISQPGLKTIRVFPQIMQQAGQLGLLGQTERLSKLLCQLPHVAEMILQQLPFA